jgi:ABC-2 type transport system permease protein
MKIVKDVVLAYGRAMRERVRVPAWVVLSLAQPLLYLFLFGPLLKRLTFSDDLYDAFVPGLLVLMAYFVAGGAGFGMLEDMSNGVIERLQVTPLSRTALVLGPALRDATTIGAQSLALLGIGQLTGLHLQWASALIAIAMVCALAIALTCLSNTLAHTMRGATPFAALFNGLSIPVLLLSGVLLPLSLAPAWLTALSYANPLRYAADAARALVQGHPGAGDAVRGLAVCGAFVLASLALSIRHFRRSVA